MLDVALCFMGKGASIYNGLPSYATPGSVGLDLRACFDEPYTDIPSGERFAVPTGLAIAPSSLPDCAHAMPMLLAGFVYSRSGLGAKQGLTVAQGVGVIDPDYRGEIIVMLLNSSSDVRRVHQGDRIAQLVFQPTFRPQLRVVDKLDASQRGSGGFGHTGQ